MNPYLVALAVAVIAGLWHRSWTTVLSELVVTPSRVLNTARERVGGAMAARQATLGYQRDAFDARSPETRTSLLAGALVATAFFGVFAFAELRVLAETLEAMFGVPVFALPGTFGVTTLLSIVGPAVFAGWLAKEIARPSLLHTTNWSDTERRTAGIGIKLILALSILATVLLGALRTERVQFEPGYAAERLPGDAPAVVGAPLPGERQLATDSDAPGDSIEPPQPVAIRLIEIAAFTAALVAVPLALLIALGLSWSVGPVVLLGLVRPGLIVLLILTIVLLVLATVNAAWTVCSGVALTLLRTTQRIGVTICRPLVTLAREVHSGQARCRERGQGFSALLYALTAPALDVEIPDDGIGNRLAIDRESVATEAAGSGPQPSGGAQAGQQDAASSVIGGGDGTFGDTPMPESEHTWGPFASASSTQTSAQTGASR